MTRWTLNYGTLRGSGRYLVFYNTTHMVVELCAPVISEVLCNCWLASTGLYCNTCYLFPSLWKNRYSPLSAHAQANSDPASATITPHHSQRHDLHPGVQEMKVKIQISNCALSTDGA
ncbi:uncharacterized protein H6S33_007670 [Morchella sextelata]|uniref:uncharacterized protein n=1 Tax=Morchella sextelata TaxID=1174677 RepID=UPI001D052EF6|nr:uncharacterized protein H6S33_007670 [Morchella sextelata]KAH0603348.1 hypothetical protein H6S33_007670 [Morchella sextelata]